MSSETSSITSPPSPDRDSAPASCPLPPKIIEPTSTHTATVIFLHGLGDKATGWPSQAIRDNKLAEELPYVRWVIPNAPEKKMTAPGYKGAKVVCLMREWISRLWRLTNLFGSGDGMILGHGGMLLFVDKLWAESVLIRRVDFESKGRSMTTPISRIWSTRRMKKGCGGRLITVSLCICSALSDPHTGFSLQSTH